MINNSNQKSALIMILVIVTIISLTFLISIFARGYIPEYNNGLKMIATGILSVTSTPKGASVIINEKLSTTTDGSLNLVPNDYQLKIIKDGYLPWNKKINIKKEEVSLAEATLFKSQPILTPMTNFGVINPTANIDMSQIAYAAPISSSSQKLGIYLIETNYMSMVLNKYQTRFLIQNPFSPNDNTIYFSFSSNNKQLIIKSLLKHNEFIVDLNQFDPKISPIQTTTNNLPTPSIINNLPKVFMATIATNPASVSYSYDETKILYLLNNQYFVYDIEKNINYNIGKMNDINTPFWLSKTHSLIYSNLNQIKSIDYDGSNHNTIFTSDNIVKNLISQFNGEKIIISTKIKPDTQENIYTLTIR